MNFKGGNYCNLKKTMDASTLAVVAGKQILDSTKPQQWVFWNYIFLKFFWWKEMWKFNEIARAEIENSYDLKRLEWKFNEQQIIQALQNADWYIEYQNLFQTFQKALPKISEWKNKKDINPDKIKRLKDLSKEFSSEDMQEVIAWILAGEYNEPWSYSLKTMDIVKTLWKEDLDLFRKFWWLVLDNDYIFWNFYQANNENIKLLYSKWIWYNEYLYLQELWLIYPSNNSTTEVWDETWNIYKYTFNIAWKALLLNLEKKTNISNQSKLTKAWKEILRLINPIYDDDLFQIIKKQLLTLGFKE